MSDIIAKYNGEYEALQKQISEAQSKAKALIKEILPAAVKDFIERHPEVYGLGWVQYAPHWNDGDACEFSAHEPHVWLSEDSLDDNGFHEGDEYDFKKGSDIAKDFERIESLIAEIEDHYLEDIYGDSVSVLFTKDGLTVRKYRHD